MKLLNCHKCGTLIGEIVGDGGLFDGAVGYCAICNNHILEVSKKVKADTKIETPDCIKDLFKTFDKKY